MAKFNVYFKPNGSWFVDVDIADKELEGLDREEIIELVNDRAYDECPNSVCAQCGGWSQNYGLDFGDLETDLITDADGQTLFQDDL